MKKTLEKHELKITIFMIVIYLVLNSICINTFGDKHFITAICNILLSLGIIIFILKNNLVSYYKLDKIPKLKGFGTLRIELLDEKIAEIQSRKTAFKKIDDN